MEPRDASDAGSSEVVEVVAVETLAEASLSEVADVTPGCAVVRDRPGAEPAPAQNAASFKPQEQTPPHRNGQLKSVIECMLFVTTEPLSAKQISEMLGIEESAAEEAIEALDASLGDDRGLQLMKLAGGYQLCTRSEYAEYCAMILQPSKRKLSKAALETLAVIAYRQPCTMPEIEAVRGVSVDGVIKTLEERGLVKEAGRKQTPGRPILYTTTPEFLEYFGLNDISELPDIDMLAVEEVRALEAQRELFQSREETQDAAGEDAEQP